MEQMAKDADLSSAPMGCAPARDDDGTVRFEMRRESDGLLLGSLDDVPFDAIRAHSGYCRTMLDSGFRDAHEAHRTGVVAVNLPDRSALCTIAERDPEGAVRLVRWVIYVLVHEDSGLYFVHEDPTLLDPCDLEPRDAQNEMPFFVDFVTNGKSSIYSADFSPRNLFRKGTSLSWIHYLANNRTRPVGPIVRGEPDGSRIFLGYRPQPPNTLRINAISPHELVAAWDVFVFLDAMACIARHAITLRAMLSRVWHQKASISGLCAPFALPDPYLVFDLYAWHLLSGNYARFDSTEWTQERAHDLRAHSTLGHSALPRSFHVHNKYTVKSPQGTAGSAKSQYNAQAMGVTFSAPRHLPDLRHTFFSSDHVWHRACPCTERNRESDPQGAQPFDGGHASCTAHTAAVTAYASYGWTVIDAAKGVRGAYSHRCLLAGAQPGLLSTVIAAVMRDWYQPLMASGPFLTRPTEFGFCNALDLAVASCFLIAYDTLEANAEEDDQHDQACEAPCFVGDHDEFCASLARDFGRSWAAVERCLSACGANLVLAGGSVVNAMQAPFLQHHEASSDLDLWIVGSNETERRSTFDRAVAIMFDTLPATDGWRARTQGSVVTFYDAGDGAEQQRAAAIQLIYTDRDNAVQIVGDFDLSHACAFYDPEHKAVWASWACVMAMVTRTTEPMVGVQPQSHRLAKARVKGFEPVGMVSAEHDTKEPTQDGSRGRKPQRDQDGGLVEQEIASLVESAHTRCGGMTRMSKMPDWKQWLYDRSMWPVIRNVLSCLWHDHYKTSRFDAAQNSAHPVLDVDSPDAHQEHDDQASSNVLDSLVYHAARGASKRQCLSQTHGSGRATFGIVDGCDSAHSVCAAFLYRPLYAGRRRRHARAPHERDMTAHGTQASLAVDVGESTLAFQPLVQAPPAGSTKRKLVDDPHEYDAQTQPVQDPMMPTETHIVGRVAGLRRHTALDVCDAPDGKKVRVVLLHPEHVARDTLPLMRVCGKPSCEACETLFQCWGHKAGSCMECKALQSRVPFARHVSLRVSTPFHLINGTHAAAIQREHQIERGCDFIKKLCATHEALHGMTLAFVDAIGTTTDGEEPTDKTRLVAWKTPLVDTNCQHPPDRYYCQDICFYDKTVRVACYSWTPVRDAVTGREMDMPDVQDGAFLTGHVVADRVALRFKDTGTKATSRFVASNLVAYPACLEQIVGALDTALSQRDAL